MLQLTQSNVTLVLLCVHISFFVALVSNPILIIVLTLFLILVTINYSNLTISFVQLLKKTINAQQKVTASLNLLGATKTQRQEAAAPDILHLVQNTAKTTTINDPYFYSGRK